MRELKDERTYYRTVRSAGQLRTTVLSSANRLLLYQELLFVFASQPCRRTATTCPGITLPVSVFHRDRHSLLGNLSFDGTAQVIQCQTIFTHNGSNLCFGVGDFGFTGGFRKGLQFSDFCSVFLVCRHRVFLYKRWAEKKYFSFVKSERNLPRQTQLDQHQFRRRQD